MIDGHISKMIVESAQILSNVYTLDELKKAPVSQTGNARKHSYPKHPVCLWIKESIENFNWLIEHSFALQAEKNRAAYWKNCRKFLA
jgi:hypothetical protein